MRLCTLFFVALAAWTPATALRPDTRRRALPAIKAPRPELVAAPVAKPAPSESVSKRQVAVFVLTYAAYVAIYFARKPVSVVKSTLEHELGLSVSALGTIDTAMLTAYAVGQFLIGNIVGLCGRTFALVFAFAACGVFTAAFGAAQSVSVMRLLSGACGFLASVVNPLLVLLIADLFPASMRASVVALWTTSQQLGGVCSNVVASAVLSRSGWRAVFLLSGAIVGVFAPILAFVLFFLVPQPAAAPSGKAAPAKSKAAAQSTSSGRSPLSLPGVYAVGAGYTLVKMARYCLMFWLPYFFTRHVKMGPVASALFATVFDMCGALGSVATGIICDSYYGGKMISLTVPLSLATGVAFLAWALLCALEARGLAVGSWAHVVAAAAVGFLIAGPDGVLGGAASRNLCDYAGASGDTSLAAATSGLVNGCGSIGAMAQGALTAQLVGATGWSGLFVTLGVALVGTSIVLGPAAAIEDRAHQAR